MRFIFIAACLSNLRRAYASGLTASSADAVFGCEQFNSTGGTRTHVGTSFTGAHDRKLSDSRNRSLQRMLAVMSFCLGKRTRRLLPCACRISPPQVEMP